MSIKALAFCSNSNAHISQYASCVRELCRDLRRQAIKRKGAGGTHRAMSNSHAHSYSRSRGGDSQTSKPRTTQHRSVSRYSPYTRPTHFSPTHGRQRFSSPASPPPVPASGSKQRFRPIGDGDMATHDASAYSKTHKRFDGLVADGEECPGCPVHPPSTRNNNWLEPTATQHRSRYRSYEAREEEEASSPLRLHSPPPPRQPPCAKPTVQALQKRMDQFDHVLSKLVRDVADIKRRGSVEQTPAFEAARSSSHYTSGPPPPPSTELDRLDRMMDQLHFLKNRSGSPARENYHYSPERRGTDSHYGCR